MLGAHLRELPRRGTSPCSSSTTTWVSCSTSATTSTCSTSAGSSPRARRPQVRSDPAVIAAYLGESRRRGAGRGGRSSARPTPRGHGRRRRPRMIDTALIDVQGLAAGYGGAPVVRDLSLNGRAPARSSPCSGRTAPARPPRCSPSPGCCAARRHRSRCSASRCSAVGPTRWPGAAWPTCRGPVAVLRPHRRTRTSASACTGSRSERDGGLRPGDGDVPGARPAASTGGPACSRVASSRCWPWPGRSCPSRRCCWSTR